MPNCNYENEQYLNDKEYGSNNEKLLLPVLNTFFNCQCVKDEYKYAIYDFHDIKKKIKIELKSRRVNFIDDHVSVIDFNKIRVGKILLNRGYTVYIVWSYLNGLYYIKLNDFKVLNEYKTTLTRYRGCEEISSVYLIPNILLTKI